MSRRQISTRKPQRDRALRLKTRLWLTFTALLVGSLAPLILLGVMRFSNRLQAHARNEAVALARNIANLSINSLLHFNFFDLDRIANEASREENVRYVLVSDRKGSAVARSRGFDPNVDPLASGPQVETTGADDGQVRAVVFHRPGAASEEVLDVAVPMLLDNSNDRWGTVRIGYSLQPIHASTRSLVFMAILLSGIVLILGTAAVALLSRHISRPLEELLTGAVRISKGDYSLKLQVRRGDEIGTLAQEFNRMAVEIERKRSELEHANDLLEVQVEEVTREKAKLAAILHTVIDGLLVLDRDGRLLLANPAAEEILQFEARSAAGRPISEIIRDERLLAVLRRTSESGAGVEADVSLPAAVDRNPHIMHTRTAVMRGKQGDPRGIVAILQDVTNLRLAERTKSEFISNVSHELRTPISIMKVGLSNLLRYRDIPEEQRRSLLSTITRENARLEVLISDLLDFSCIEAGRFTLRRSDFDLREVVSDVAESLRARTDEAQLRFEAATPSEPLIVHGDKGKLRQVVMNLVLNAINYTPTTGGRVKVGCSIDGNPGQAGFAAIEVSDSGVGIPEKVLPHIFERFYRGHASQITNVPGTGLGLAIVKEIVEAHGGRIRVQSREKEGSVFTVTIPLRTGSTDSMPGRPGAGGPPAVA